MRQKARIIQISGLRGMVLTVFIVSCLVAGFVGFPSLVMMYGWNFLGSIFDIPQINVYQGFLLWVLAAGTIYILNDKNKYLSTMQIKAPRALTEEEFKKVIEKARIQAQAQILKSAALNEDDLLKVTRDKSVASNPISSNISDEEKTSESKEKIEK